jgi:hypothetical protein
MEKNKGPDTLSAGLSPFRYHQMLTTCGRKKARKLSNPKNLGSALLVPHNSTPHTDSRQLVEAQQFTSHRLQVKHGRRQRKPKQSGHGACDKLRSTRLLSSKVSVRKQQAWRLPRSL